MKAPNDVGDDGGRFLVAPLRHEGAQAGTGHRALEQHRTAIFAKDRGASTPGEMAKRASGGYLVALAVRYF
jgi:hypothetical protein